LIVHPLAAAAAAAVSPSWLWYATRGLGTATLIVLTITVALGIVTAKGWMGERTPAFVAADLHRNVSLLGIALLVAHIVTTVLDPFAHITVRDVVIPVGAEYRPVWLGLGVAATWVLVAVTATSLLRERIGPRAWRLIHWIAYSAWPLAVIHGLGTGSDAQAPWLVAVVAACVAAVIFALYLRLREGRLATFPIRAGAAVVSGILLVGAGTWAFTGPFQPGWAAKAGTPSLKTVVVTTPGPVHPGPGGFSDPLAGVLVRDRSGNYQISMRDMVDTGLTLAIRSPSSTETLPVVTISRDSKALCTVPATAGAELYAICRGVRLTITFYGLSAVLKKGGDITGKLETSGPLN
jgi:sulfoxide reductase heme-binding subunit YedZ